MRPLFKKELRALLPLWSLGVLVFSGDFVARPFYQRLDELSWLQVSGLDGGQAGFSAVLAMLATAMAFSTLPREHDDGTIHQLYALPVTRSSIFGAKALAGIVMLSSVIVLGELTNTLLISLNHQTYTGEQWRFSLVWRMALLKIVVGACFYAYAILCSWLRRFGLALLALLVLVTVKLDELRPSLRALNPLYLIEFRYEGKELVMPWRELGIQLGVAALLLCCAGWLWMSRAESIGHWFQVAQQQRSSRWLLRAGAALAFGLGFTTFGIVVSREQGGRRQASTLQETTFGLARAESQYFTFTYSESTRERALALIAVADDEWRYVKQSLGASDYPGLLVDLDDRSGEHDGIAAWSKVRVSLPRLDDAEYARFVLVHELLHIAQQRESGRRLQEQHASTGFFSEGMAQYGAYERVPQPVRRRYERIVAIETLARQHIPFEVLTDHGQLRTLVPPTADYSLGQLWTEALVSECGADAPRRVIHAFARSDAPQGLSGRALWSDTLQAIQCSLERVLGAQARLEQTLRSVDAELVASIPRLSGGLVKTDMEQRVAVLVARADRPVPANAKVVLTLRGNSSESDEKYGYFQGSALSDGTDSYEFRVPFRSFAGERFQFAFGVELMADVYPVYEPFRDARLVR